MKDVYMLLRAVKGENESFSEVLRRKLSKSQNIMELAGEWEMSDEEAETIKKKIKQISKRSTEVLVKSFGSRT